MTVYELMEKLSRYPQNLPIALSVYGHSYGSVDHKTSHGSLKLKEGTVNGIRHSVFIGPDLDCVAPLTQD